MLALKAPTDVELTETAAIVPSEEAIKACRTIALLEPTEESDG